MPVWNNDHAWLKKFLNAPGNTPQLRFFRISCGRARSVRWRVPTLTEIEMPFCIVTIAHTSGALQLLMMLFVFGLLYQYWQRAANKKNLD